MRKGLTRLAASAMSLCLLASAAPAAIFAQALAYPGDAAMKSEGCQYTPARGGSRPWVSISWDKVNQKIWMVDKSTKIRVIKGDWTSYRGMPGTEYARPSSDKTPLNQQPNWDKNAEMMHNVEKVYSFYKNTLGHSNFNFAGGSDQNIYVYSFPNPGDARAHVIDDIGSQQPNKLNWLAFGDAGTYTYSMGSDLGAVGHEFTHLVSYQKLGWLPGMNTETDALMEAYSDILGELCETNPDWKVAGDAFKGNTATNKQYSYRDLANPGATNDPLHGYSPNYDNYYSFKYNRAWLENNHPYTVAPCYSGCTVVGHAAYLMYNSGIPKNDLAKIWYNSMNCYTVSDTKNATFSDCRKAVVQAAKYYYGTWTQEARNKVQKIENAFNEVCIYNWN